MGLNNTTRKVLAEFLPGRILALGFPDGLEQTDTKGSELVVIDIIPHRGTEIIRDLSSSKPLGLGLFDVVLDHGTIEHCSNPAQAFMHAAESVKVGGVVIHHLPITMINHGYWNVNPQWYGDFYCAENGFKLIKIDLTLGKEPSIWPGPVGEPMSLPMNSLTLAVARRETMIPVHVPSHEGKWRQPSAALQCVRRARTELRRTLWRAKEGVANHLLNPAFWHK